jgi:hypothetical protein
VLVDDDLAALARTRLTFPVATKGEFVRQIAMERTVTFAGMEHESRSAGALIPAFFFPLVTKSDFHSKVRVLLVSRGLIPAPRPRPSRPEVKDLTRQTSDGVVAHVRAWVAAGPGDGQQPDRVWVDTVDYLTHALDLVQPSGSFDLWRAAVLEGELATAAAGAVETMVEVVRRAASEGRWSMASEICDCLAELVDPSLMRPHVGGFR